MGFGCGGADYGKVQPKDFGGGSGAGGGTGDAAFRLEGYLCLAQIAA